MKKSSFGKKLLSLFLAVVMALSCCTAALSAFGADSETNLYENPNNKYDYLGWIETTDEQKITAFLDMLDELLATAGLNEMLADALSSMGMQPGQFDVEKYLDEGMGLGFLIKKPGNPGGIVDVPIIEYDLSSIDGVFKSLASVENLLSNGVLAGAKAGFIGRFSLRGVYQEYTKNFNGTRKPLNRTDNTSKEILAGLANILYMNTNDTAWAKDNAGGTSLGGDAGAKGGSNIQQLLGGAPIQVNLTAQIDIVKIALGQIEGGKYGSVHELIGGLLGIPNGWEMNSVNNIVTYFLKSLLIDPMIVDEKSNFPNRVDTTSSYDWKFLDDDNKRVNIEDIILKYLNDLIFPTILNVNGDPVFDGKYAFKFQLSDSLMAATDSDGNNVSLKVIQGILDNALAPLFGTISIDFGYIPEITRMYTSWRMEQPNKPTTVAEVNNYWTWKAINEWIENDTENIVKYLVTIQDFDGTYLCQDLIDSTTKDAEAVKATLVQLFNHLDREGTNGVDLTYLFTNMLYSPIAAAMNNATGSDGKPLFGEVKTGMLNLTIRDQYFGMFQEAFIKANPYKKDVTDSIYPILLVFLKALFPTFFEWANVDSVKDPMADTVNNIMTTAGTLLTRVANNANKAILADTLAEGEVLSEANLERAITPLMVSAVMHAETFSQVHPETWDKVKDLNGLFFLLLAEYLKSVLPEFDYMPIADMGDHFEAPLDTVLLPMARDCIAVIAQGIVPIKWDVYKLGGIEKDDVNGGYKFKDNTDVFSLVNNIVCFFMDDLGLGSLLGFSDFAVYGTGSATHSAINMDEGNKNTLWDNLDLIMNRLMPVYATLFGNEMGEFKSKAFFIDTILKGGLDSEDVITSTSENPNPYAHNMRGLSTILYNFGYALFQSDPLTKTPIITLAYEFIRNILNVVIGPRNGNDIYPGFETFPADSGLYPITDLIQSHVLFGDFAQAGAGENYGGINKYSVPKDGVLGIAVARLADALGATDCISKISANDDGIMTKGVMNLVYIVNALIPFFPNLGQNTLHGANAWFTKNMHEQGEALSETRIAVENPSAGLKRALMNEDISWGPDTEKAALTERYFMVVKSIQCMNDENLTWDGKAYVPTAKGYDEVSNGIIKPTQTLFYNVSGTPNGTGTKEFKITYKVVHKDGTLYEDYDNLTTYAYMLVNDGKETFVDELYNTAEGANGNFETTILKGTTIAANSTFKYPDEDVVAVKTTPFFNSNQTVSVAYPATIVVNDADPASLEAMKVAFRNTNDANVKVETTIKAFYPYVIDDGVKKAMVACDEDGNLVDYSLPIEYYHPIDKSWTTEPSIKHEINGIVKDFSYTATRFQIGVKAADAKKLLGYNEVREDGKLKYILINYNEDVLTKVSCASPIEGTYVDLRNVVVPAPLKPVKTYGTPTSWLHAIPGASVEVPIGVKSIDLCVGYSDTAAGVFEEGFSVNIVAQHSAKKAELENKFNQVRDYVDAHVESDFTSTAVLSKIQNELLNAYKLINAPMTRTTTDATFDAQIKALNDAVAAANKAVTHETAKDLATNVIDKFNGYDAYDYYNINYNLTRNIKELGWNVLSREYDNPDYVLVSSTDKDFTPTGTYVFKNAKGEKISEENYVLFLAKVAAGVYDIYGLTPEAKEGVDFTIGVEEPQYDDWGSPKYNYSSTASVVEMKEIMRLYNLYEATMKQRGYSADELKVRDIRTALRKEIECATNASNSADVSVNADGTLNVKASSVKYGAMEGGVLVNNGPVVYTPESWQAYVDAVKAAVNAANSTDKSVSKLNALRLDVMHAENNLEELVIIEEDTYVWQYHDGTEKEVVVNKGDAAPADPAASPNIIRQVNESDSGIDASRYHVRVSYAWSANWEKVSDNKFVKKEIEASKTSLQHGRNTVVIKPPTHTEPGLQRPECPDCGYIGAETETAAIGVTITIVPSYLGSTNVTGTQHSGTRPINNTVEGGAPDNRTKSVHKYNTEYTLTATPAANAKFVGWYTGGKLISTEAVYKTYAYADTVYQPVYVEKENEAEFTVTFMGYCGNILRTVKSTDLSALTAFPTAPNDYPGVEFKTWDRTLDEVKALKESTIVYAQYTKTAKSEFTVTADGCNISVDGATPVPNSVVVAYDQKVTIRPIKGTATTWFINKAVAGYGEELSFYVSSSVTVTYSETTAVDKNAVVTMISMDPTDVDGRDRVRFVATRNVPADKYELIESGFVYSKSDAPESELVLDYVGANLPSGNTICYMKMSNLSPEGQFGIIFSVGDENRSASARAYIMYKDVATGEIHVDYSSSMRYTSNK